MNIVYVYIDVITLNSIVLLLCYGSSRTSADKDIGEDTEAIGDLQQVPMKEATVSRL